METNDYAGIKYSCMVHGELIWCMYNKINGTHFFRSKDWGSTNVLWLNMILITCNPQRLEDTFYVLNIFGGEFVDYDRETLDLYIELMNKKDGEKSPYKIVKELQDTFLSSARTSESNELVDNDDIDELKGLWG
jgi:hypothetical protein